MHVRFLISVADDDDFLSKEELLSIQKGLEDIKNGRTYRMQEGESLTDLLKAHRGMYQIEFSEGSYKGTS